MPVRLFRALFIHEWLGAAKAAEATFTRWCFATVTSLHRSYTRCCLRPPPSRTRTHSQSCLHSASRVCQNTTALFGTPRESGIGTHATRVQRSPAHRPLNHEWAAAAGRVVVWRTDLLAHHNASRPSIFCSVSRARRVCRVTVQ